DGNTAQIARSRGDAPSIGTGISLPFDTSSCASQAESCANPNPETQARRNPSTLLEEKRPLTGTDRSLPSTTNCQWVKLVHVRHSWPARSSIVRGVPCRSKYLGEA